MTEERISAISRLRMGTDGHGVTALVVFHGCPLRCKYCINRFTLENPEKARLMTSYELLEVLLKDELYYVATGGGVTLGGGEPLLRPQFIMELMELGARRWHTTVETSLNIPTYNLSVLLPYIDEYIVDIKDMNPEIYQRYTGHSNRLVLKNLNWLVEHGKVSASGWTWGGGEIEQRPLLLAETAASVLKPTSAPRALDNGFQGFQ